MRILIKGGVWKNTEDEILKAAVMKYGKNQWARVASLLSRKSAKQCKARWYEWLDPSIKKIEWSREEEEKLLHLAKLMPNQWRTIAPIVGRTAGQCIEHYERLLDQAQEATTDAADDPRRLRPGEIDPAPESKPARPDPIDMDEDEKEMLAEARARLANTKGKKAKRKARERQLEESRRLSSLQKRRELKAAGIESKLGGSNKRKYIDYSKEIPFQKVPPAGFYDVGDEIRTTKSITIDPATQGLELSKLEGRHEKEEEERERNKDKKRLKTLFKANAPQAIMNISAQNDPTTLRKRSILSLPAPQVSDGELEDIVKAGQSALMLPPDIGRGGSSGASNALIGDYSAQFKGSLPTPLRTPLQENIVMQEAKNARILRDMAPFAGDELPELFEGTGYEGVNPRAFKMATPNTILATPGRGGGGGGGVVGGTPVMHTPGSVTSNFTGVGSTASGARAVRDHLGLNDNQSDGFSLSGHGSLRSEKQREREHKLSLAKQLGSLPEPEFVYELAIPDLGVEQDQDSSQAGRREDAADIAERLEQQAIEQARLELERRSTVLKRALPRPALVSAEYINVIQSSSGVPSGSRSKDEQEAAALVDEEMVSLLLHDERTHPNSDVDAVKALQRDMGRGERYRAHALVEVEDQYLASARQLVAAEYAEWQAAGSAIDEEASASQPSAEVFNRIWDEAHKKTIFLPTRGSDGKGVYGVPENKQELLTALSTQFAAIRARIDKESKKSLKVESKLNITTKGYYARAEKLESLLESQYQAYWKACTDLECFRNIHAGESRALTRRLAQAKQEMLEAEATEAALQQQYAELKQRCQLVQ